MKQIDLTGWSGKELRELADRIYKNLGLTADIDLEREMVSHYHRCNRAADLAFTSLENGNSTAGSAAVLSAATGSLRELSKMQTDLYNAERVKVLERCMIEALKMADNAELVLEEFSRQVEQSDDRQN